jgi:hypothetical protein
MKFTMNHELGTLWMLRGAPIIAFAALLRAFADHRLEPLLERYAVARPNARS